MTTPTDNNETLSPEQEAALKLIMGGTVADFFQEIDAIQRGRALIHFLHDNPHLMVRAGSPQSPNK